MDDDLRLYCEGNTGESIEKPVDFEPYQGRHWAFRDLSEASPIVVWEGEGMTFSKKINEVDQMEADIERIKAKMDLTLHRAWFSSLSSDELQSFSTLLLSPNAIKIWIQHMNARRASGSFRLSDTGYLSLATLFERVLDVCLATKDIVTTRSCIILSQTFYKGSGPDKEFIQSAIASHPIWHKPGLWDSILTDAIESEIDKQRLCSSASVSDLRNVVFVQLSAHAHLLHLFGVDGTEAVRVLRRRCLRYHLDEGETREILGLWEETEDRKEVQRTKSLEEVRFNSLEIPEEPLSAVSLSKLQSRRFSHVLSVAPLFPS